MHDLIKILELKRKELNIESSSNKPHYLKKIEKSIESLKKASIKKQKKINYKASKKEYKTTIGTMYIHNEEKNRVEVVYKTEDKKEKEKIKDKAFRINFLRKKFGKGYNSQKKEILMEWNVLNLIDTLGIQVDNSKFLQELESFAVIYLKLLIDIFQQSVSITKKNIIFKKLRGRAPGNLIYIS